ncbi:hypothetical protein GCM10008908_01530 [Clostridium subterminale]|uniref:DUF3899 domain-containing protein n=1 Tax=Clostridium subterminale TaxID=1550 RepID=A0ABN1KG18_CLOSU
MRDILILSLYPLSIMFYCIAILGYIRHIKVSKKLKKQKDTEIENKETVSKETLDELKVAIRLILIGSITPIALGIIRILILKE